MLVILTTHPIQYQVPIWQALAKDSRVSFEVWYLTRHGVNPSHDVEFKKQFSWDIDMLSGYPHRFLDVVPNATPTSFWNCRLRERLRDRLKAAGATAVWIQGWQVAAYWQAVWEAKRAGIEIWLRGESNDLAPTAWWKRPIKRLLLGQLFRRVDHFLYIGTANRRLYQKFGVPEHRLHPAPYAVDNERFARQAEQLRGQRSEIRKQWNIPEDAFCILFCGKFIPKKRPMDLIEAAKLLQARSAPVLRSPPSALRPPPSVHLLFVGSGELGPQLRSNSNVLYDAEVPTHRNTDLPKHTDLRPPMSSPLPGGEGQGEGGTISAFQDFSVSAFPSGSPLPPASFAGFLNQTEISKAYVAADCLVLPSDYGETWGLVVNEAMASGLPCIISDRCGCAEDLGLESQNKVFSCCDSAVLAEKIMQLRLKASSPRPSPPTQEREFSFDSTVSTVCELLGNKRECRQDEVHA